MEIMSFIVMLVTVIIVIIQYILIDFWPAILMGFLAITFLILLCCMASRRKKAAAIFAVVMMVCIIGAVTWCVLFPTAYPYVDLWVLGKTEEEIIARYGEPRFEQWESPDGNQIAYYTKYIFLDPDYYIITFDEEGKAVDVKESIFVPKGG